MNKKTIITILLALVTVAGQAQTKTVTVTGYSPALKDGTLVLAGTGTIGNVVDTVQAGRSLVSRRRLSQFLSLPYDEA